MRSHIPEGTAVFVMAHTILKYRARPVTQRGVQPADGYLHVTTPAYEMDSGGLVPPQEVSMHVSDKQLEEIGQWLIEIAKSKRLANALE